MKPPGAGVHHRIPYLKNLVGQVAPQALPDAYETTWSFFSDQTGRFSGQRRRSYETSVSFSIRPPNFLASGWAER